MLNIDFDGTFDIAVGRSRKEISWKNQEITWSAFIHKVSTTHHTAELFKDYLAAKKPRQDEIKDIGGFVGGHLTSGRRKAGNVLHRQLVTLDVDFATADFWDDFQMLYDNAAVIYSTHKHSPENPRLRLIIPLDRPVFADEYMAIARRIAGNLGIDNFDHTTFEPSRLMYWPSTAKDGQYFFTHQDGSWICADEVLATYRDWRDSSQWPMSSRGDKLVQNAIKKQGDPLEKTGIVGAFCRCYTIDEVIETYLGDVYEACDIENRYTFKEGSTAAGLVVYGAKYAYSHHGTDPTSSKLCNAFDLVRIHKFGLKDDDAREGTPGSKLPSFTAMMDLAAADPLVRKRITQERKEEIKDDFLPVEIIEAEVEENDDWLQDLEADRKGNYQSTINNIVLILSNDKWFKGNITYDEFEHRGVLSRNLPWRKVDHQSRFWTDMDDDNMAHYLEKNFKIIATKLDVALSVIHERHKIHPIRNYLNGLSWDGQQRLDTLFIDYLGAEDNEYIRAVTRKVLVGAVARVFEPGCKFDYMTVFVGTQGMGKSSLIGKLGGEWFSDSLSTVLGKEAYEQLQGAWLIEMGELSGMRKADVESVKHFLSKRVDRYRVAYGKRVENFPRQCIVFGSTNREDFLRDPTGNRRFWPVLTNKEMIIYDVHEEFTADEVGQVWAEAMHYYKAGEPLYLTPRLEELARQVQEDHSEYDERAGLIREYLDTPLPADWDEMGIYDKRAFLDGDELATAGTRVRTKVCAAEIWCELFKERREKMDTYNTKFIHEIMKNMSGWKSSKIKVRFPNYGILKGYFRIEK